jgi:tetratricopeptide (TPR) repeat protein
MDEAIAEYREALNLTKDFAPAHYNLGSALYGKGQLDEAVAEFRETIRLKKDYAPAHNDLGNALRDKGQLDEAIVEWREAVQLQKDLPQAHNNLGAALREKGQMDEAIAECREAIRLKKDYANAHYNLAMAVWGKGQLDEAIAEFREAIRIKQDFAAAHNNLGNALRDKGRLDEAIAEYRDAIRFKEDYPDPHINLANALQLKGQLRQAVEEFRLAHELGSRNPRWPHPSAQWLRRAQEMADLDDRLPDILQGKARPKDAAECLTCAQLCQLHHGQYATATRFYGEAFAGQPALAGDLQAGHRYNAACAAARAGCGQGKDADGLDNKERARLRLQALDWLRADLEAWGRLLEKEPGKAGPAAAQTLQHWLEDPDFSGVRGEQAVGRLPEAERGDWQKLWQEVEALRERAARPPKP